MKEKTWAEVDGKEVEVEIVEKEEIQKKQYRRTISNWRLFLPAAIALVVLGSVAVLSVTVFIWALPVLLPFLAVWFIVRLMQK